MSKFNFSCFKAYDVRGKIGEELSNELVYNIGKALAVYLQAKEVVLGSDVRLTSPEFKQELARGLMEMGTNVIDIGTTGTEEVYFATSYLNVDGGVQVTASHNPKDYNGLKIVGRNSIPLGIDSGLRDLQALIEKDEFVPAAQPGTYRSVDLIKEYTAKLLTFSDTNQLATGRKLKVHLNIGNGAAGRVAQYVANLLKEQGANLEFSFQFLEPDGNFPNGIPNPLLVENRLATSQAVLAEKADIGVAFDGDFDRCFFFDEQGRFIDGYYICSLLAQAFLAKNPGAAIVHEPRLYWNTVDVVEANGGRAINCKAGHSFIKAKLRAENAVYGGEISAHHYFRDYYYCDSGMIPWMLIVELVQASGKSLSELVTAMKAKFPCSDEINFKVTSAQPAIDLLEKTYASQAKEILTIDGLSLDMGEWRFNVRASNTEPYVRINVESRGNPALVEEKVAELSALIKSLQ